MRRSLPLPAVILVWAVSGCTAPIVVEPAPYAGDPGCAAVMLGIPDEVGGLQRHETSSQATASYGDEPRITVRCGVEVPGPSNERCVAIDTPAASADWLVVEEADVWRATAFGRTPAMEVVIPKMRADQAVGEILAVFSPSATLAEPSGLECR
ncbi:DUF3515 family protein [Demequina sp.]|uniref:DUF3515 family protein n=1 Tax=Demequina sp. TaxID=2050685 RepID=UPI0025C11F4E|nr:DUF3515 family protein [Demequina sp.]